MLHSKNLLEVFQFHKGTIRTSVAQVSRPKENKFQFHKGTIRTSFSHFRWSNTQVFQFHKGTIRTIYKIISVHIIRISIP